MIHDRAIVIPADIELVREFLSDLWPVSRLGSVWDIRRWEGSVFYGAEPSLSDARAARSRLWLDDDGTLVAAAMSEGGPEIHPHVRPGSPVSLKTVVAWAEAAGAAAGDEHVLLSVWTGDEETRRVAVERGYRETDAWDMTRSMRSAPIAPPVVPAGYTLRPTRDDPADDEAIAVLLNAAFGRTFHHGAEHAGLARHATCFQAHMLGAETITVSTGDMDPANALYASLPFTAGARGRAWELQLTPPV